MSQPEQRTSYKVGTRVSRGLTTRRVAGAGDYTEGWVGTKHGVVGVYSQTGHTMLIMVHQGRERRAWWDEGFSDRSLVRMANAFAVEIVGTK